MRYMWCTSRGSGEGIKGHLGSCHMPAGLSTLGVDYISDTVFSILI